MIDYRILIVIELCWIPILAKGAQYLEAACSHEENTNEDDENEPIPRKCRRITTLRLGYPFQMAVRLVIGTCLWHLTVEIPTHNRQPSPASPHPIQRALDLTHKKAVVANAIQQGRTSKEILTELRETDPDTILIPRISTIRVASYTSSFLLDVLLSKRYW